MERFLLGEWLGCFCFSTLGIHKEVGFKTGKSRERKHPGATAIAVAKESKLQSEGHGSKIRKEEAQGSENDKIW